MPAAPENGASSRVGGQHQRHGQSPTAAQQTPRRPLRPEAPIFSLLRPEAPAFTPAMPSSARSSSAVPSAAIPSSVNPSSANEGLIPRLPLAVHPHPLRSNVPLRMMLRGIIPARLPRGATRRMGPRSSDSDRSAVDSVMSTNEDQPIAAPLAGQGQRNAPDLPPPPIYPPQVRFDNWEQDPRPSITPPLTNGTRSHGSSTRSVRQRRLHTTPAGTPGRATGPGNFNGTFESDTGVEEPEEDLDGDELSYFFPEDDLADSDDIDVDWSTSSRSVLSAERYYRRLEEERLEAHRRMARERQAHLVRWQRALLESYHEWVIDD